MKRREHLVSSITLVAIVLAAIAAWRAGYFSADKLDAARAVVAEFRKLPMAPVYFGAAYALSVLLLLSTTLMSIVGGALFGLWGLALAWPASLIGSAIAHAIGRGGAGGPTRRFLGRHPMVDRLRRDMTVWDLMRLRVLPIAPFGVLPYLAGMTGIALRYLLAATAVAELPTMAAYVYAGSQLGRALEGGHAGRSALLIAGGVTAALVATAAIPTVAKFIARRRRA